MIKPDEHMLFCCCQAQQNQTSVDVNKYINTLVKSLKGGCFCEQSFFLLSAIFTPKKNLKKSDSESDFLVNILKALSGSHYHATLPNVFPEIKTEFTVIKARF